LRQPVIERAAGRSFLVLPDVFNPVAFRTGRYLAEYVQEMPTTDTSGVSRQISALDVGTGCGIHAIIAAERGFQVDAVDISPAATQCARINVILNDVESLVTVHQGDLFEPVAGRRFDLVMCSLPKFRGQPESNFELSWRSIDVIDKFTMGLSDVLTPQGVALVLLTSHGDERGMLDGLISAGLDVRIDRRKHFGVEIMTIYRVTHLLRDHGDQ
jgi:SAM-dependent methyltransferase